MPKDPATGGLLIVLQVPDVAAAADLYCHLFEGVRDEADPARIHPGGKRRLTLRLVPLGAAREGAPGDGQIRLELVVDDLAEWLSRALAAGCRLAVPDLLERHRPEDLTLVEFYDPFGHLWLFARARDAPARR